MTTPSLELVKVWVTALAVPFYQNRPDDDGLEGVVELFAESLMETFEKEDFTAKSRIAVGRELKWFQEPEIGRLLNAWIATQKRPRKAPEGPLVVPSPEVLEIMMRGCGGAPGPLLTQYLADRGIVPPYPQVTPLPKPNPVRLPSYEAPEPSEFDLFGIGP